MPGQIPGVRGSLQEGGIFAVAAGAGADPGEPEEVCHADLEERTGGNEIKGGAPADQSQGAASSNSQSFGTAGLL